MGQPMPRDDRELSEAELIEVVAEARSDLAAARADLREIKGLLGIPLPRPDLRLVRGSNN